MSVNLTGIFDPNSPLIMGAAISTTSTITILAAAATDGQTNDAPLFILRNYYDADAGAGVTSTAWDLSLLHDMTAGGATPASSGIWKINNVTVVTLTQTNGTPSATFPGAVSITGILTLKKSDDVIVGASDGYLGISGGADINSARIILSGSARAGNVGEFQINTPNAALSGTARLVLSGGVNTAVAAWSTVAHTGFKAVDTFSVSNTTEGYTAALNIKTVRQVVNLTGAQTSTTINIPSGAMLLGASFNVDTAVVTSAATNTWDADFTGGSTTNLVAASTAGAQNTKANKLIVPEIASAQTNIEFDAPGAETFSSGAIEVVAYYIDQTSLANA